MSDFVNLMRGYWNNNHIGLVTKERLLDAHKAAIAQAVKKEREQCIQKLIAWKSFHIKKTIDTGGSGIMVSAIYDEAIEALKDRP